MEVIGIVLLFGLFGVGLGLVYIFLRYLELLRSVEEFNQKILSQLNRLEEKLELKSEPQTIIAEKSSEQKEA